MVIEIPTIKIVITHIHIILNAAVHITQVGLAYAKKAMLDLNANVVKIARRIYKSVSTPNLSRPTGCLYALAAEIASAENVDATLT